LFCHKEHAKVQQNIEAFLEAILDTYELLFIALEAHWSGVGQAEFDPFKSQVMHRESEADDLRRQIAQQLYKKSLLPELRKDILLTINQLDTLPDQAELIVKCISELDLRMPPFLLDQERELLSAGLITVSLVSRLTQHVFDKNGRVEEWIELIDQLESKGDLLESEMITSLFQAEEVRDSDKILLREKISKIGKVLDLCQTISDHLTIISIKRQV
jgi:predicted phosphate transport protein (TIGR00153 family)